MDDTFCLFHLEQDAIAFFDHIDSQHPNTRFTMEKEVAHILPFLDVVNTDRSSVRGPSRVCSPITSVSHLCHTKSVLLLGFIKDIVKFVFILRESRFPVHLIGKKCGLYRCLNTGSPSSLVTVNMTLRNGVIIRV